MGIEAAQVIGMEQEENDVWSMRQHAQTTVPGSMTM